MANVGNTPEPAKSAVSENKPAETEPVVEETAPAEEVQVAPTTQPEPVQAPAPVDPCVNDKATAVAPLQAQLSEYDRLIAERTAWLTEKYHTMKALGRIDDWVTLDYYLNYDLSQTLRPVRDRIQVQYDAEASKFAC